MAIIKSNRPRPLRKNGKRRSAHTYQYHSGLQPWLHNPPGEDDNEITELGGAFADVPIPAEVDLEQGRQQQERQQQAIRREEKEAERDAAMEEKVQSIATRRLSLWSGRSFPELTSKTPRVTAQKAKQNLNSFIRSLAANVAVRTKWQKWCENETGSKPKNRENWQRLKELATFVITSYLPSGSFRSIQPDQAFWFLVCGGKYEAWYVSAANYGQEYGEWNFVDIWINYVRTGQVPEFSTPYEEDESSPYSMALVPHGNVKEMTRQAVAQGTYIPKEIPPEEEYGEEYGKEDEQGDSRPSRGGTGAGGWTSETIGGERKKTKDQMDEGIYEGQKMRRDAEWSKQLSKLQKERFARRTKSPRFDKELFDDYIQFLEMQRRTTPVPPVVAFLEAPGHGVENNLTSKYSLAKGSIILVHRWNGNTQVIIPSNSTSTVLTRRGRKFGSNYAEGEPTWFPIAEFINRPDLFDEKAKFGGDITSLAQAFMFTFTWRTHSPSQDKYLKYPVHIYTEVSGDPSIPRKGFQRDRAHLNQLSTETWDDLAAQQSIDLLYLGSRQPPSMGRVRLKQHGIPQAQKILSGDVETGRAYSQGGAFYDDDILDKMGMDQFNNPRRRRTRLLPNHGSRIRRKY